MRKWVTCILLFILCVYTLIGCADSDNNSGYTDSYAKQTPTNAVTNVPIDKTINKLMPSLSSSPVTSVPQEETLDDLTDFIPLYDCYLDYDFQIEELGIEDDRCSYKVSGNFDLNRDGKEDRIEILLKGRNKNLSYIEINQNKCSFNMDNPFDEVHIIDLDKNDPYLEVACYDDGPSGDPVFIFFRYDGSNIYELGQIDVYASIDGKGKLVSYFDRNNYFKPKFCSAWYEIIDHTLERKNNNTDQYLGRMYDFAGGEAYFLPYEELPDQPDIQWDEMVHFEACKVRLIDLWGGGMNYYYIELPTGEKGLLYFWIGD